MRISKMPKEELGPLLKKLREDADIPVAQMAVDADVTAKTIENWERAFSKPRLGDVLIYQKTCGRTIIDVRDEPKDGSNCDTRVRAFWTTSERRRPRRVSRRRTEILMRSPIQAGSLDLLRNAA